MKNFEAERGTTMTHRQNYKVELELEKAGASEWVKIPVGAQSLVVAVAPREGATARVECCLANTEELQEDWVPAEMIFPWGHGDVDAPASDECSGAISAIRLVADGGGATLRGRAI